MKKRNNTSTIKEGPDRARPKHIRLTLIVLGQTEQSNKSRKWSVGQDLIIGIGAVLVTPRQHSIGETDPSAMALYLVFSRLDTKLPSPSRSFVQESAAAKFRTKTKSKGEEGAKERNGEAEKVATKNAAALLLKEGRRVSEAITNVNLRHSTPLFPFAPFLSAFPRSFGCITDKAMQNT